jgi:ABC-type sulfate/molybdate transport systems ATPase subunit
LDEPFSQVDNFQKNSLRRSLFAYLKDKGIACVVATHDSDDALSFADRMIVLRDQGIEATGSPQSLFENPPSKYVASLFDDVNEVLKNGTKEFLYPHQIGIVDSSVVTATVINSYFKGSHWLIELNFEDQILFVRHNTGLKGSQTVCLEFN